MVQVLEKRDTITTEKSSSWKLEYDKKVKMSVEEQSAYRETNWDNILEKAKALDEVLSKCEVLISDEDEIADVVSKYRRERYEESRRS